MSEHWKSTPKYWCKHCKTFVRDTKLERQNHDATPKHQGNLKRLVRDLHRSHEKDEKDKDRAKSEIARLNGLISGSAPASSRESSSSSSFGRGPTTTVPKVHATPSQRKQQLAQLAEMGVSIPEEFRGEMAMAGEWQVTSERVVDPSESSDKKPEALGFGVRKRTVEDEEEVEDALRTKKKRWGSTFRTDVEGQNDLDLDQLLENSISKITMSMQSSVNQEFLVPENNIKAPIKTECTAEEVELSTGKVKVEFDEGTLQNETAAQEVEKPAAGLVFKRRPKTKNLRRK